MGTIMITKMTGQTAVFGMPSCAFDLFDLGLGLNGTGASLVTGPVVTGSLVSGSVVVSGLGNDERTRVEAGLSLGWSMFAERIDMRDERPTEAPKAAVAAAMHGRYGAVAGVGAAQKQNEQQIEKMRAFRGPEPWRERT